MRGRLVRWAAVLSILVVASAQARADRPAPMAAATALKAGKLRRAVTRTGAALMVAGSILAGHATAATSPPRATHDTWAEEARAPAEGGIPLWAKIAGGVGGVALLGAGGAAVYGRRVNGAWEKSRAAQEIAAAASADPAALKALLQAARIRVTAQHAALGGAASKKAQKAVAFELAGDRLAAAHAELLLNERAGADGRPAEKVPAAWTALVHATDAEAQRTGHEGALAKRLVQLLGEITAEQASHDRLAADVAEFDKHVPPVFGGKMAATSKVVKAALARFATDEIGVERALHERVQTAMRGRVVLRLAREKAPVGAALGRRDALASLEDEHVTPAAELADGVLSDLSDVIRHRDSEAMNLAIAETKTHVPVERVTTDDKGNRTVHIDYEDQSGFYRMQAAGDASAAQRAASSAQARADELRRRVPLLARHPAIAAEQLHRLIPTAGGHAIGMGPGVWSDLVMPPVFTLFGNVFAKMEAQSTRDAFSSVAASLRALQQEVRGRRGEQQAFLDREIDSDLTRQMAEVG